MNKFVIAILLCFPFYVNADKIWYSTEDVLGSPIVLDNPPSEIIEVCDEDCVGEVIVVELPSIGNKHAVVHGELAKQDSGRSCRECHTAGGEAVVANDSMLCSQYSFIYPGRTITDPVTGLPAKDPVSGTTIVSGKGIAVLYPNDQVLCSDCHNPHRSPKHKVEDFMVHAGCLDCHRKVGSGDRREDS